MIIDKRYLELIDEDKREEAHNNLIRDVYYFYNNYKPNFQERILMKDGNIYNLDKDNLICQSVYDK